MVAGQTITVKIEYKPLLNKKGMSESDFETLIGNFANIIEVAANGMLVTTVPTFSAFIQLEATWADAVADLTDGKETVESTYIRNNQRLSDCTFELNLV